MPSRLVPLGEESDRKARHRTRDCVGPHLAHCSCSHVSIAPGCLAHPNRRAKVLGVEDAGIRSTILGGVPVDLSPLEYRLVAYLMLRRGRVVSLQELVENVHGDDEQRSNAIEVLVGRVRRKLGGHWIETRRGFGYMIPEQPA